MMTFIGIAYVVLVIQVTLGVAMIATSSVAANRSVNAPERSVSVTLYVLGCSCLALGVWASVMLVGAVFYNDRTFAATVAYFGALLYVVPLLSGGLLQARIARALLNPPAIEQQRKDEWRIALLRFMGWALVLMPLGMPLGIFAGLYFAIAAAFGASLKAQQESLLLILAIAVRTQAPLAEEVDTLADSSRGRFRRRLRKLAHRLREGDRLSDALGDIPGLVPSRTVTAIRVGEDLGNLVPVIQHEAIWLRRREESRLEGRFSAAGLAFYLCCVLCVMQVIVAFLMYWIMPKFKKIIGDFGIPVPEATARLIRVSDYIGDHAGIIALWMAAAILGGTIVLVRRGGWAAIDWGFLSLFYPRLETPGILRNLAQAVAVRRPLAAALAGLELHHRRRHVRKRIRRVRDEVEQGNDCFQPLCQNGLINRSEAAALASAERAGNLAWALERIADHIESRQRARGQALVETLQPAIVISLGVIVLCVCVAIFIPLIHLLASIEVW